MKKILFILGEYYPNASANGICTDRIIQEFIKKGYAVECVANEQGDAPKVEITHGVRVHRVPILFHRKLYEKAIAAKSKLSKGIYSFCAKTADYARLIPYLFSFPLSAYSNLKGFVNAAEDIVKEENIVAVVGVNMPPNCVYAANIIKNSHPELVYVPYFLDPLAGGMEHTLLGKTRSFQKSLKLEKKIIQNADRAIVMLEHRKHYEKYYKKAMLSKSVFLGAPLLEDNTTEIAHNNPKIVIYAGALDIRTRNPAYIIEVFKYVKSAKLIMYISQGYDWARNMGNENVEIKGKISHDEMIKLMRSADAFVNIGNNETMFSPSKVIEYIGFGKPIISTYRIDEDTSIGHLSKYPLSVVADERNQDPREVAKEIDDILRVNQRLNYDEIRQNYYINTPEAFFDSVSDII